MGHIRYDIVPNKGGWSIACRGVVGLPYLQREVALGDATWVADLLGRIGEDVEVYVDGKPVHGIDVKGVPEAGTRRRLLETKVAARTNRATDTVMMVFAFAQQRVPTPMKTPTELVATFRPTIDAIRQEVEAGIPASRAMELEIDLTVELRRFDLACEEIEEAAELDAFRDEITSLLRRLADR